MAGLRGVNERGSDGLLAAAAAFGLIEGLASASALAQDDKAKLRDALLELEIASWQYTKDKNAAGVFKAGKDYVYVLMPLTINI